MANSCLQPLQIELPIIIFHLLSDYEVKFKVVNMSELFTTYYFSDLPLAEYGTRRWNYLLSLIRGITQAVNLCGVTSPLGLLVIELLIFVIKYCL